MKLIISEVAFMVSEADNGLRERLDQEIDAFNGEVTGHYDGMLLCIAVRDDDGDLRGAVRADVGRMRIRREDT